MNYLTLLFLAALSLPAAEIPAFHIPNGDMTLGEEIPTDWAKTWAGTGTIAVTRDKEIFHTPPAAMRLGSVGGPARGNVAVRVDINGAHAINLTGWIRTTGKITAHVYAEAFNNDWSTSLAFMPLQWLPENPPDTWTEWQGQINLPEGTAHVMLCVLIDGDGVAWLDDVRDIRDPAFATVAK